MLDAFLIIHTQPQHTIKIHDDFPRSVSLPHGHQQTQARTHTNKHTLTHTPKLPGSHYAPLTDRGYSWRPRIPSISLLSHAQQRHRNYSLTRSKKKMSNTLTPDQSIAKLHRTRRLWSCSTTSIKRATKRLYRNKSAAQQRNPFLNVCVTVVSKGLFSSPVSSPLLSSPPASVCLGG